MARYLITHSLLASWMNAIKEDPYEDVTTERDRYAEFMDVLNRVHTPTTEAMQNGIDFEHLVLNIADCIQTIKTSDVSNPIPVTAHRWYDAASKVADIVRGGQFQVKAKKPVTVNGTDFLLYGRLDVLKAGSIDDIKFTKNYERGKYFVSTQHPMYFELIPEARLFSYLVSNGTDVWAETYTREETRSIYPVIGDFADWLHDQGLFKIYAEKWEALH